jgi:preprotein translocase subunit SecG
MASFHECAEEEFSMTLNKLAIVLTGMFVTGAVFFTILLRRSEQVREQVSDLRQQIRPAV